jgi:hypothetical protein
MSIGKGASGAMCSALPPNVSMQTIPAFLKKDRKKAADRPSKEPISRIASTESWTGAKTAVHLGKCPDAQS